MMDGLDFGALDPMVRERLISTGIILLVLLAIRWILLRMLRGWQLEPSDQYRWRKAITYTTAILIILLGGRIWSSGMGQLGTFLGLVTAALAIALKEPVTNLAGWIFIVWRRPFKLGDRIQIGAHAGDVVDIRIFQFSIMEIGNWVKADGPTGRIIHVPNGRVFSDPQANYNSAFPFIWNELPVLVTFESNWQEAKRILSGIARTHGTPGSEASDIQVSAQFAIAKLAADPSVITSVEDSGVLLTIRYLCRPLERRRTAEAIWESILTGFGARDDIDFAYPTTRFYANPTEGKPGARASLPPS